MITANGPLPTGGRSFVQNGLWMASWVVHYILHSRNEIIMRSLLHTICDMHSNNDVMYLN